MKSIAFLTILCLFPLIPEPLAAGPAEELPSWEGRPNRVLLVIGDQWLDPHGYLIGGDYPSRFKEDLSPETDLLQVATLLKSWGIPFDIARLDQEILNRYHFLGPDGKPLYGAVVWDADPQGKLMPQDYGVVREAVEEHGIGLVALSNRIRDETLEKVLGIRYLGYQMTADDYEVRAPHFITRGLPAHLDHTDDARGFKYRVKAEAVDCDVIAVQGEVPQITVRRKPPGGFAIWIGGDHARMFTYQTLRTLFKRSITWAAGFAFHKDWSRTVIVEMDDPGGAQSAWLDHWHYPTLTAEEIRTHLIDPLEKHGGMLVINVNPGFVNDQMGRVEPAWTQRFTDAFGTVQDYPSTKKGLDEGIEAGVFEIQSHGWTHMQPDLVSCPGPWWGAPRDGEKAEIGWYREFYDIRRRKEIPPALQTFHLKTSIRWIRHQFGVTPLSLIFGGGANSREYANDSYVLAAKAGFGSVEWCYAGRDFVLRKSLFQDTADAPAMAASPPDGHDRGITMDPKAFLEAFETWKGYRMMGRNEYVAYTHAEVRGRAGSDLRAVFAHDDHYCRHFAGRPSEWTLHLADWLREAMDRETVTLFVDQEESRAVPLSEFIPVEIPPGTGLHTLRVE